jgi:hypothetical protein
MSESILLRASAIGARVRAATPSVGLVFALLFATVCVPIFAVKVAPLNDYINHLARMHVMAVGGSDRFLSAFYAVDWQLLPNLAMDLVVPRLARVFDIYTSGQIFVALTMFMLASGPMAISWALNRRFEPWPLVAFLILYNQVFLVGLMNYLMGAGFAMWGLAAWIVLRERSIVLRMAVSGAVVALTFLCHLCAVGLYGLAIGSYELWLWYRRGLKVDRRLAFDFAALAVPALPIVPLLLASATWGLAAEYEWSAQGKLDSITMIFRAYSDPIDIAVLAICAVALAWAVRRSLISFHPAAAVFAVVSCAVFLALPTVLFGSYMADQRLPVAMLLTLIGFGSIRLGQPAVARAFIFLVLAISTIRVGDVTAQWLHLAKAHDEFRAVVQGLDRGQKFIVAYADEPQLSQREQDAISHLASTAVIERSALVSTEFTVPGKQILRVRSPYEDRVDTEDGTPPNISQLIAATMVEGAATGHYWDRWQEKHDFVLVLFTERGRANPDPDLLSLVHDGNGFQLYEILR